MGDLDIAQGETFKFALQHRDARRDAFSELAWIGASVLLSKLIFRPVKFWQWCTELS